jgi:hypothetical protein
MAMVAPLHPIVDVATALNAAKAGNAVTSEHADEPLADAAHARDRYTIRTTAGFASYGATNFT